MSEYNTFNWLETLASVFERSARDPEYRNLCLTDPVAAIKEVSDIELPPKFNVSFYERKDDLPYAYCLPKPTDGKSSKDEIVRELIQHFTVCTILPTTFQ